MFGLGPWEIAVIVGAVLIIAGPALLPKLGRYLGRTLTDLRDSAESFSDNLREEIKGEREEPVLLSPGVEGEELGMDDRETKGSSTSAA